MNALAVLLLIPATLLKLFGAVLGLIVVPLGILTQYMSLDDHDHKHWPDIFWLWGNDEDGVNPQWWQDRHPNWPHWWQAFVWLAIRNPVNNHRYLFKEPDEIVGKTDSPAGLEPHQLLMNRQQSGYRWVRAGWMCGYRKVWLGFDVTDTGAVEQTYSEVWIGWKLGSTVPGLGFTFQVRLNRAIGT